MGAETAREGLRNFPSDTSLEIFWFWWVWSKGLGFMDLAVAVLHCQAFLWMETVFLKHTRLPPSSSMEVVAMTPAEAWRDKVILEENTDRYRRRDLTQLCWPPPLLISSWSHTKSSRVHLTNL